MATSSTSSSTSSTTHSAGASASATSAPAARSARAAALPVWLLRPVNPLDPPFYLAGVPTSIIVAAATAAEARAIAAGTAGPHDAEAWLDEAMSSCDALAPEEPAVIAKDFGPPPAAPVAAATGAPPVNVDVPYVSGVGVSGGSLSCTMGNWEGMQDDPATYAYAWMSDGAPNSATGDTYWISPSDVGHEISCLVTATNAAGSTAAPPSNAVAVS